MSDPIQLEIEISLRLELWGDEVHLTHGGSTLATYRPTSGTLNMAHLPNTLPQQQAAQKMVQSHLVFYKQRCREFYAASRHRAVMPLTVHAGTSPGSAVVRCEGVLVARYEDSRLELLPTPSGDATWAIRCGESQIVEACEKVAKRSDKVAMADVLYEVEDSPLKQHLLKALEAF